MRRRELIQSAFGGLGTLGLSAVLGAGQAHATALGHYTGQPTPGRAKRVISLFLAGGPSQVDLFDPKPLLKKFQGQRPGGTDLRTERQTGGLMPSPFEFNKRGVSEILPKLAQTLGVSMDELLIFKPAKATGGPKGKAKEAFEAVSRLPRRQQEQILKVVNALVAQAATGN